MNLMSQILTKFTYFNQEFTELPLNSSDTSSIQLNSISNENYDNFTYIDGLKT